MIKATILFCHDRPDGEQCESKQWAEIDIEPDDFDPMFGKVTGGPYVVDHTNGCVHCGKLFTEEEIKNLKEQALEEFRQGMN